MHVCNTVNEYVNLLLLWCGIKLCCMLIMITMLGLLIIVEQRILPNTAGKRSYMAATLVKFPSSSFCEHFWWLRENYTLKRQIKHIKSPHWARSDDVHIYVQKKTFIYIYIYIYVFSSNSWDIREHPKIRKKRTKPQTDNPKQVLEPYSSFSPAVF